MHNLTICTSKIVYTGIPVSPSITMLLSIELWRRPYANSMCSEVGENCRKTSAHQINWWRKLLNFISIFLKFRSKMQKPVNFIMLLLDNAWDTSHKFDSNYLRHNMFLLPVEGWQQRCLLIFCSTKKPTNTQTNEMLTWMEVKQWAALIALDVRTLPNL